jgi:hypothetical protein
MKRRVADLGFALASFDMLQDNEGAFAPALTIVVPETDDDEAKSVTVWNIDGLHNLRDMLAEGLDEFDSEQSGEGPKHTDGGERHGGNGPQSNVS